MIRNIPYYALCLAAFLSPFFMGTLDVFPQCVFLSIMWLLFLVFIFTRRGNSPAEGGMVSPGAPFYAFLAYAAVVFLSASLAPEARWASRNAVLQIFLYILFFSLPLFLRAKDQVIFLLKTAVFSGFCAALYGIGFYILYNQPDYFIFSTFLNPNECAGFLILLISLGLALYLYEHDPMKKYRFFLFIVLMGICVILTASRAAWASFFLATFYFALRKPGIPSPDGAAKHPFTFKLALFSFLILFFFLLAVKAPIFEKFTHVLSLRDRSLMFRTLVWKSTLRMALERPLNGFGPGSFEWWYPHFKFGGANTKMVHNTFIQQFAETGFVGFSSFMFFIASLLSGVFRTCRAARDREQFLFLGIGSAFIGFLLHNTFDYTYYIPATGGLFFLLAGCFSSLASFYNAAPPPRKMFSFSPVLFAGLLAITPVLFYFSARAGISDFYVQKAWNAEFDKNFQNAYAFYRRAAAWDAQNAEVQMQVGVYARYYKDYARSTNALTRAVRLVPSYASFHTELGFTFLKAGKKKKAMSEFLISSRLNPSATAPKKALAQLYFNDAVDALQKHDNSGAFFYFKNALQWLEKINALSRSVYESNIYEPLAGRERNKDFLEAETMITTIKNLQAQLKEDK